MTAALVCVTAFGVATLIVLCLVVRAHEAAQAQWFLERRELLNRIQAPQHIPLTAPEDFVVPETEDDDSNLVGTIRFPDDPEKVDFE